MLGLEGRDLVRRYRSALEREGVKPREIAVELLGLPADPRFEVLIQARPEDEAFGAFDRLLSQSARDLFPGPLLAEATAPVTGYRSFHDGTVVNRIGWRPYHALPLLALEHAYLFDEINLEHRPGICVWDRRKKSAVVLGVSEYYNARGPEVDRVDEGWREPRSQSWPPQRSVGLTLGTGGSVSRLVASYDGARTRVDGFEELEPDPGDVRTVRLELRDGEELPRAFDGRDGAFSVELDGLEVARYEPALNVSFRPEQVQTPDGKRWWILHVIPRSSEGVVKP